jgi:hypothetical protein
VSGRANSPQPPTPRAAPAGDFAQWRGQLAQALRDGGTPVVLGTFAIVALMVAGSALMWIGMPVLWLWLASHLQNGTSPSLGPYLVVAAGLPISMVLIGKGLHALDRSFSRLVGFDANDRRVPLPWLKSMRDGRGAVRRGTVLDIVMIFSVLAAGAAMGFWFFFIAGSSLPGT